jgi:hypothetical protein
MPKDRQSCDYSKSFAARYDSLWANGIWEKACFTLFSLPDESNKEYETYYETVLYRGRCLTFL